MDLPELMSWIEHREKKILLIDHKNLAAKEYEKIILETFNWFHEQVSAKRFQENELLLLVDLRNTAFTHKAYSTNKRFEIFTPIVNKHASVGLSKVKKTLLTTMFPLSSTKIKLFDNRNDALDWLTKE